MLLLYCCFEKNVSNEALRQAEVDVDFQLDKDAADDACDTATSLRIGDSTENTSCGGDLGTDKQMGLVIADNGEVQASSDFVPETDAVGNLVVESDMAESDQCLVAPGRASDEPGVVASTACDTSGDDKLDPVDEPSGVEGPSAGRVVGQLHVECPSELMPAMSDDLHGVESASESTELLHGLAELSASDDGDNKANSVAAGSSRSAETTGPVEPDFESFAAEYRHTLEAFVSRLKSAVNSSRSGIFRSNCHRCNTFRVKKHVKNVGK